MSYHPGNEALLDLLENLQVMHGILYVREGIMPQCKYSVSFNSVSVTFKNILAVSGVTNINGIITNKYISIDQPQTIYFSLAVGNYAPVYIDLSNNTIGLDTAIAYDTYNCSTIKGYIYNKYISGVPWDETGNMPVTNASDPTARIYIGYLCMTSLMQGDGNTNTYIEFIPQYAATGIIDTQVLILPSYIKEADTSAYTDTIKFKYITCNSAEITLSNITGADTDPSKNIVFTLDKHESDIPKSITFTEVLSSPQIADTTYIQNTPNYHFGQIVRTHDRLLVYNGNPLSHLAVHDIVYPYYLDFDFTNQNWLVRHIAGGGGKSGSYMNLSSIFTSDTPDSNILLNYIIMTIEWGADNIALLPGKPASN